MPGVWNGELSGEGATCRRREGCPYGPAAELLARIRAEREGGEGEAKAARKEKRKKAGTARRRGGRGGSGGRSTIGECPGCPRMSPGGRRRDGSMVLSDLATAIYDILRDLVPGADAEIAYSALVERLGPLPPPNSDLAPRDPRLDDALGALTHACRQFDLPAISALVVHKDDHIPGPGYYPVAHPDIADNTAEAMVAWGHEIEQARATTYPNCL
jgi:hypothetical protein